MSLAQGDIYTLALTVGLTPARARTAAAIAMAESSGNPAAHNATGADDSYGLWQINMKGALGPARRKQLGLTSDAQLLDPQVNAHAMAVISHQGANFLPWSTYVDGAYASHLSAPVGSGVADAGWLQRLKGGLKAMIPPLPGLPGVPDLSSLTAPFADFEHIVQAIDKTAVWLSNSTNWLRILYVLAGAALGVLGVTMVVRDTPAGRATTTAVKAASKGAALA